MGDAISASHQVLRTYFEHTYSNTRSPQVCFLVDSVLIKTLTDEMDSHIINKTVFVDKKHKIILQVFTL